MLINELKKVIAKYYLDTQDERGKEFKVSFDLKGEVICKQGEDYEQIINFAIPYEKLFAVALNKLNGVTVESLLKEALNDEPNTDELKERVNAAMIEIKGKGKRKCSGKVTIQNAFLNIENIEGCEYC
jgi:hypothetical protein